jgi:hypothetical protein
MFTNGDFFSWSGTDLTWQGVTFIFDNSTGHINDVADQTSSSAGLTDMADGDAIYVDLDRTQDRLRSGSNALTPHKAPLTTLGTPVVPGSRWIIAWRYGSNVFARNNRFPVGQVLPIATTTAYGAVKLSSANTPDPAAIVPALDTNHTITVLSINDATAITATGSNESSTSAVAGKGAVITGGNNTNNFAAGSSGGGVGAVITGGSMTGTNAGGSSNGGGDGIHAVGGSVTGLLNLANSSAGHGVIATGGHAPAAGNGGDGVQATGGNNTSTNPGNIGGNGLTATGGNVSNTGGTPGFGVSATGGNSPTGGTPGIGVMGVGGTEGGFTINAPGGKFSASLSSSGSNQYAALQVDQGNLEFTTVGNPSHSVGFANTLTPKNTLKAWVIASVNFAGSGTQTLVDGFNVSSVSVSSGFVTVNLVNGSGSNQIFAIGMFGGNGFVGFTSGNTGSAPTFAAYNQSGQITSGTDNIYIGCYYAQ